MKIRLVFFLLLITMIVLLFITSSKAQLVMTVNSLADDQYAYAWDDPATPEDESIDGICGDELGRCTIRAAIDESNNMSQSLNLFFSVSGLIDLTDVLYLVDGTTILGNNQVEISGDNCFDVGNDCQISQIRFNGVTFTAITVNGDNNTIGASNIFINNYIAVDVWGNSNSIGANRFGVDENGNPGPNNLSILVTGNSNSIDLNTICNSMMGISIAEGELNEISRNNIGTNSAGTLGLGNVLGIAIDGSGSNLIGGETINEKNVISGNSVAGISIGGVPPDNYSVSNGVWSNIIGLDPTQSYAVPNGNGVVITNGARIEFLGRNIIAGNSLSGVHIFGQDDETKTYGHTIAENKIGVNSNNVIFPNGMAGISIQGNVEDVTIGTNLSGMHLPNIIVGNQNWGISAISDFGYNPSKIQYRKNNIYQNSSANVFMSTQVNNGLLPPYSLSFNNNTIAGIHDVPGALIDIYKANINEFSPSAYEWLGSTTVGSNGVFSYEITNPSIEAVSLTATDNNGNTSGFAFLELITDVEKENDEIPERFSLDQNYPNPFNPSTKISFSIPTEEFVSLKVFNSLGEEAAELINETKSTGNYSVSFDASNLSSGIYFYKITAGNFMELKKMMLIK
ncbi:MAG: T9SS type A sorting domain-containing protein [Ignavibacterium sp.]|nr:T9SS type A sorting domain-containing protein [Ignavibacterium sp.]